MYKSQAFQQHSLQDATYHTTSQTSQAMLISHALLHLSSDNLPLPVSCGILAWQHLLMICLSALSWAVMWHLTSITVLSIFPFSTFSHNINVNALHLTCHKSHCILGLPQLMHYVICQSSSSTVLPMLANTSFCRNFPHICNHQEWQLASWYA